MFFNPLENGPFQSLWGKSSTGSRRPVRRSLIGESLEDRRLLTASLAPIANLTVPALQGYTLPLNGSGTADAQTFTVHSSDPNVAVSIATGPFWNVGVSYTDPNNAANDFTGTLTFQLFQSLTPNTVKMITQFTNDNFYVNSGKFFWRVVSDFGGTTGSVIQGGSSSSSNSTSSGQPGTPFANEDVQQLPLTGIDQISMANAGGTDSNDSQFFINTGPLNQQLGYQYTVFGQLVSGASTLAQMASIPVGKNPNVVDEQSEPVNPLTITSTSLTSANSNGVVLIDTTQARPGELAAIDVTANDAVDGSHVTQPFLVTVGPFSGSTFASEISTVNFKPYASPVVASTPSYSPVTVQLAGQPTFPDAVTPPVTVSSYSIVSNPGHGTITAFNPATGALTYTPNPGFLGSDTFTYVATSSGPSTSSAPASSNPATVTIVVNQGAPVTLLYENNVTNKRHQVTALVLFFSGPLDASMANSKSPFRLGTANRRGAFSGRGSGTIPVKKVIYNSNTWTVTLIPKKIFAKTKNVQLLVYGDGTSGLKDIFGRYIDGAENGQAGSNSVSIV